MKDFAGSYIKWYDGLGKVARLLLCLLWDIPSNLRRFSESALRSSTLGMILAVVLAIFGGWLLFVIDIVCIAVKDKVYWLGDLGINDGGSDPASPRRPRIRTRTKAKTTRTRNQSAKRPGHTPRSFYISPSGTSLLLAHTAGVTPKRFLKSAMKWLSEENPSA